MSIKKCRTGACSTYIIHSIANVRQRRPLSTTPLLNWRFLWKPDSDRQSLIRKNYVLVRGSLLNEYCPRLSPSPEEAAKLLMVQLMLDGNDKVRPGDAEWNDIMRNRYGWGLAGLPTEWMSKMTNHGSKKWQTLNECQCQIAHNWIISKRKMPQEVIGLRKIPNTKNFKKKSTKNYTFIQ